MGLDRSVVGPVEKSRTMSKKLSTSDPQHKSERFESFGTLRDEKKLQYRTEQATNNYNNYNSKSSGIASSRNKSSGGSNNSCDGIIVRIASLNDAAIFKWAIDNDRKQAQDLLTQALHRVNSLSRTFLAQKNKRTFQVSNNHHQSNKSPDGNQKPFVVPLPVDIDTKAVTLSFNRAYLLKASVVGHHDGLGSVFITAAVVFYNVALFFHHHQVDHPFEAFCHESFVEKYYGAADRLLKMYMDRTHCPLWSIQAAIWYNLADCTRVQAITPTSSRYFGQLETILKFITDSDDQEFFKHAISVARMQMNLCYCAVVA